VTEIVCGKKNVSYRKKRRTSFNGIIERSPVLSDMRDTLRKQQGREESGGDTKKKKGQRFGVLQAMRAGKGGVI